jgi:hypothetical protein
VSVDSATAQVGSTRPGFAALLGCDGCRHSLCCKRKPDASGRCWCDVTQRASVTARLSQLGKKERTLQEVTSPAVLARTASDQGPSCSDEMWVSDGSATPRGGHGAPEQPSWRERPQQQRGWQRQPSNLGRSAAAAEGAARSDAAAPASHAVPAGAGTGSKRVVPPLRLTLPS